MPFQIVVVVVSGNENHKEICRRMKIKLEKKGKLSRQVYENGK